MKNRGIKHAIVALILGAILITMQSAVLVGCSKKSDGLDNSVKNEESTLASQDNGDTPNKSESNESKNDDETSKNASSGNATGKMPWDGFFDHENSEEAEPLPSTRVNVLDMGGAQSLTLEFSSGAGAWKTDIKLSFDGTFTGYYSDTNAGASGDGYNGEVTESKFVGNFKFLKQINDHTYSLVLDKMDTREPAGKQEIIDNVLHKYVEPYGLETGKEFFFYTPAVPFSQLPSKLMSWWPGKEDYITRPENKDLEHLGCYALYNKEPGYAFTNYYDYELDQ